jgi:hypothetical protein
MEDERNNCHHGGDEERVEKIAGEIDLGEYIAKLSSVGCRGIRFVSNTSLDGFSDIDSIQKSGAIAMKARRMPER